MLGHAERKLRYLKKVNEENFWTTLLFSWSHGSVTELTNRSEFFCVAVTIFSGGRRKCFKVFVDKLYFDPTLYT